MSAIMITVGNLHPDGAEHLQKYAAGVIPLLEAAGVKIHGRYHGVEALVGKGVLDLVAIMEFSSVAAMKTFLASPDYLLNLPHREKAFLHLQTFACESL